MLQRNSNKDHRYMSNHRITEGPELKWTPKDHRVQLLAPHNTTQNQSPCLRALSQHFLNSIRAPNYLCVRNPSLTPSLDLKQSFAVRWVKRELELPQFIILVNNTIQNQNQKCRHKVIFQRFAKWKGRKSSLHMSPCMTTSSSKQGKVWL